jgi:hypothetical protein
MGDAFQEMKDLLAKYEACYRELYEVQVRERECLGHLDVAGLDANNNRKETLAFEVRMLEETRVRLAQTIAGDRGMEPTEVNLSFLAAHSRPELAREFQRFAREFKAVARDLDRITQGNHKLVLSSLNTARNMERVLQKLVLDTPTYLSTGEMNAGSRAAALFHRTY